MEHTITLGGNKKARRVYGFDEVSLVPSALSVDPRDVETAWTLGRHRFAIPIVASAMDAAVNVRVAAEMTRLGGFAVLNAEGLQTRYEDAEAILQEIAESPAEGIIEKMQQLYASPVRDDLLARRVQEIKAAGGFAAVAAIPPNAPRLAAVAVEAGADLFVVASQVATARHLSTHGGTVDLAQFCRDSPIPVMIGNCVSFQGATELMEAGASALLVGVGPGAICTTRTVLGVGVSQVTAVADCAAARDAFRRAHGPSTSPSSPTAASATAATCPKPSRRVRTPSCSALRSPPPPRPPPPVTPGAWRCPTPTCRAAPASKSPSWAPSARSCSARPTRTTAP